MDTSFFSHILGRDGGTIPLIIDEKTTLDFVSFFSKNQVASLEECKTWKIENIYLYEKDEEKKYLWVKNIRDWIWDLAQKPYEWKNLFLLRDFDEATLEAMNASLKALEEPPPYAIILLIVKNPESLLETIRSRTMNIFRSERRSSFGSNMEWAVKSYVSWNIIPLIEYINANKLEEWEILELLIELLRVCNPSHSRRIEAWIEELLEVHENPRNILDKVILYL